MTYSVCPTCRGTKQMRTIGGMTKGCTMCDGLGYAKADSAPAASPVTVVDSVAKMVPVGDSRASVKKVKRG